jgi:hypothetical protein
VLVNVSNAELICIKISYPICIQDENNFKCNKPISNRQITDSPLCFYIITTYIAELTHHWNLSLSLPSQPPPNHHWHENPPQLTWSLDHPLHILSFTYNKISSSPFPNPILISKISRIHVNFLSNFN